MKKVFTINEKELNVSKILGAGVTNTTPIEQLIAIKVLLDDEVIRYKRYIDFLEEQIKNSDYEENLKSRGLIDEGDKVEVDVKNRYGDNITVYVSKGTDSGFNIDALKEKSVMDSIVPNAYKKISVTLDKKKLESDYDAGILNEEIKRFIKKNPKIITKLRKSIKKGE
jgi:hypothetical protein